MNGTTTSANPSPEPLPQQSRPKPMLPISRLGVRTSILAHPFPSFYACYLLKSIQTPESTATYIGSTPSPPRRIRQHNGEISAGARRTKRKRPWVMQMIVHGFPSRLAALKFEWAWAHPHKSRHLRDADVRLFGRRSLVMNKNIAIIRAMIARHPFNTWPLHVKLFTEEAVRYWEASARLPQVLPLPPGFTCSVELEGVDGKSGITGSGRKGPIAADDEEFTAALLAKNTALIASGRSLDCAVCHKPLHDYDHDPLSTTLCPSTGCVATSHLACLGQKFLKEEGDSTNIVPRGGNCPSCGNYTLWGDIVRGCYRRLPDRKGPEYPDIASDDMFETDDDDLIDLSDDASPKRRKSSSVEGRTPRKRRRSSKRKGKASASDSSDGESFDFNDISSSSGSNSETPAKRKPGRPRVNGKSPVATALLADATPKPRKKRSPSPSKTTKPDRKGKGKASAVSGSSSDGESFDFNNISSSSDSGDSATAKRKPGRPRKVVKFAPLDLSSPVVSSSGNSQASSSTLETAAKGKRRGRPPRGKSTSDDNSGNNEGILLDLTNIASGSGIGGAVPVKRKVGRPRSSKSPISSKGGLFNFTSVVSSPGSSDLISPKRKAGRPPKNKSTNSGANGGGGLDLTKIASGSGSAVPLKRQVGRPRMNESSSEGEIFGVESNSGNSDPISPKRKPGRPPKDKSSSSGAAPLKRKVGRPRSSRSPISNEGIVYNFTGVNSRSGSSDSMSPKRKVGRPRKEKGNAISEVLNPTNVASSSGSVGAVPPKRKVGRPRKSKSGSEGDTVDFTGVNPGPSAFLSRKVTRPYKDMDNNTGGSTENEALNSPTAVSSSLNRKVGRPRRDTSGSSEGETFDFTGINSSSGSSGSISPKRKVGRPRQNFPLVDIRVPLLQHKSDTHGHKITTLAKRYTMCSSPSRLLTEPTYAGNSSDIEILHHIRGADYFTSNNLDERILHYHASKITTTVRSSSSSYTSPGSWPDKNLERAMSTLSVSTPSRVPNQSKNKPGKGIEVIVLSD